MRKGVISTAQLVSLAALLAGLPVALYLVLNAVRVWPKAAVTDPHLFFAPAEASLPPDQTLELKLDAKTYQIGFAHVELTFDTTKVNLASEITTTDLLKTVVQKTSKNNANATGRVVIALGLSTEDAANPPTGIFSFASLEFTAATSAQNVTTPVSIDPARVELYRLPENLIPDTTVADAILTVNPTGGPTSSPTPTVTPGGPTATNTPTPTKTPTPSPTPTGVLTPSPTPTGGPFPTPTIDPTKTQLTIRIRLQGITVKANDQRLRFKFVQNGVVEGTFPDWLTTNGDDGVYTASFRNIPPGTYDLYVKSRSHLQRRFPLVTLDPGVVVLDLTKNISF